MLAICVEVVKEIKERRDPNSQNLISSKKREFRLHGYIPYLATLDRLEGYLDRETRSDSPVTKELTCLDTAYTGLSPVPVLRAVKDFMVRRSRGIAGPIGEWPQMMAQVRGTVAKFISAKPSDVAFITNATEGTNIVAASLSPERADSVVWDDLDYPFNVVVWLNEEDTGGVENRAVKSEGRMVHLGDFERLVDSGGRSLA